mmetsp:Transcript_98098/g.260639  ORF Transcript_98098/g.260639 Transcript_98098/m.260639 type:complete len:222 (-) Transcript_98098:391-1056(-)
MGARVRACVRACVDGPRAHSMPSDQALELGVASSKSFFSLRRFWYANLSCSLFALPFWVFASAPCCCAVAWSATFCLACSACRNLFTIAASSISVSFLPFGSANSSDWGWKAPPKGARGLKEPAAEPSALPAGGTNMSITDCGTFWMTSSLTRFCRSCVLTRVLAAILATLLLTEDLVFSMMPSRMPKSVPFLSFLHRGVTSFIFLFDTLARCSPASVVRL